MLFRSGAFVELEPGIEGLVHVSHIAKEHIEKPADVLKVNQSVEVRILEYVAEEKKVKLSMKAVHEPIAEAVIAEQPAAVEPAEPTEEPTAEPTAEPTVEPTEEA